MKHQSEFHQSNHARHALQSWGIFLWVLENWQEKWSSFQPVKPLWDFKTFPLQIYFLYDFRKTGMSGPDGAEGIGVHVQTATLHLGSNSFGSRHCLPQTKGWSNWANPLITQANYSRLVSEKVSALFWYISRVNYCFWHSLCVIKLCSHRARQTANWPTVN